MLKLCKFFLVFTLSHTFLLAQGNDDTPAQMSIILQRLKTNLETIEVKLDTIKRSAYSEEVRGFINLIDSFIVVMSNRLERMEVELSIIKLQKEMQQLRHLEGQTIESFMVIAETLNYYLDEPSLTLSEEKNETKKKMIRSIAKEMRTYLRVYKKMFFILNNLTNEMLTHVISQSPSSQISALSNPFFAQLSVVLESVKNLEKSLKNASSRFNSVILYDTEIPETEESLAEKKESMLYNRLMDLAKETAELIVINTEASNLSSLKNCLKEAKKSKNNLLTPIKESLRIAIRTQSLFSPIILPTPTHERRELRMPSLEHRASSKLDIHLVSSTFIAPFSH